MPEPATPRPAGGALPGPAVVAALWALLVVAASFMSWGTLVVTLENNPLGELMSGLGAELPDGIPGMSGSMTMTIHFSGWSGSISLVEGLELPNATVPCVALVLAVLAWLRVLGVWAAPRLLELLLGALAAAMLVVFVLALLDGEDASLGPGAWIALAGIGGGSIAVRAARSPGAGVEA